MTDPDAHKIKIWKSTRWNRWLVTCYEHNLFSLSHTTFEEAINAADRLVQERRRRGY